MGEGAEVVELRSDATGQPVTGQVYPADLREAGKGWDVACKSIVV